VLTLVREVDDAVGIAFALETLGRLRVRQGHLAEAVELFTQVLEIAREHDSRDLVGRALFRLGDLYGRLGDRSRSASHVIEAVAVFDRIGAPVWQARAREALGRLHAAAGDAVAAAEVRQAALRLLATAEPGIDAELSKRIDAQLRNAGIDADQPQGVSPPV